MPMVNIIRVGEPVLKSKEQFLWDLEKELQSSLDLVRRRHLARRQLLTMTWKGQKPRFGGDIIRLPGTGILLIIRLRGGLPYGDREDGNNKWVWVNDGTDVRYAVMTPGFQAKTARGVFRSRPGIGGFAYLDKFDPRPGISARRFDEDIMEIESKRTEKVILDAVGRALKKK